MANQEDFTQKNQKYRKQKGIAKGIGEIDRSFLAKAVEFVRRK